MVEDQVKVEVFSSKTDIGSADKLTVGSGVVGVVGVFPPPPPPPPQDIMNKIDDIDNNLFMLCINLTYLIFLNN